MKMADAEVGSGVGGGGGAPLPPKRPTIIRPAAAAQDEKRPVPQRPAPARPAPPPPGGRPGPPASKPPPAESGLASQPGPLPPKPSVTSHPPAPAKRPDPPALASSSKSNVKSEGSVRKRPEITIVDARPMSQAGFRDLKAAHSSAGSKNDTVITSIKDGQGDAPALPSRPVSMNAATKHVPPSLQPPPPIPASRPGVPPAVPSTSPKPAPQPAPPVPQHPVLASAAAENGVEPTDPSPRPARPTILRPPQPKPMPESGGETLTSPPPVLPKRSPNPDIPPPKPARSAPPVQAAEEKSEEASEKTEERVVPKKPIRVSIIRPFLKRKSAVDQDDGEEAAQGDEQPAGPPPHPGPPARPVAVVAASPWETSPDAASPVPAARPKGIPHNQQELSSERVSESVDAHHPNDSRPPQASPPPDRSRPPPVPASRPHVPPARGGPRPPEAGAPAKPPPPAVARQGVGSAHLVASTAGDGRLPEPLLPSKPPPPEGGSHTDFHPGNVPPESGTAHPSRPPPPMSALRPQPPPHPANRPLPSVPSPTGESDKPAAAYHLYEEVEVTEKKAQAQTREPKTEDAVDSSKVSPNRQSAVEFATSAENEDVFALYAKVNKLSKSRTQSSEEDQAPGGPPSPFGIKLKHVTDVSPDSEQSPQQKQQSPQDGDETYMKKPPVTAPKPKPSVLPKSHPAKLKMITSEAGTPPALQQQSDSSQSSAETGDAEKTKPKPIAKRLTIIRPGRPGLQAANNEETGTSAVQMREKHPDAAPRPQSFTEISGDNSEKKSSPEPPVPSRRPVTIIGFPHRPKPQEEDTKPEIPNTLPPVPRQRRPPYVERATQDEKTGSVSAETEGKVSLPPVSRPPPPRPDSKPAKPPEPPALPESLGGPRSESEPARPQSPAPPCPARPAPPKDNTPAACSVTSEGTPNVSSTPCCAPPIKRKEHSVGGEEEEDVTKRAPSRRLGPPPRPVSMPPIKSLTPSLQVAQSAKDSKGDKPARAGKPASPKEVTSAAAPPLPPRPGPSHPLYSYMMSQPHAIALHDYPASHEDELPFQEGDTVVLLSCVDDQWLKGKVGDQQGIFPQNFVSIIHPLHEELPPSAIDDFIDGIFESVLQEKPDNLTGPRCRARFDFEGEGHGDLAFEDGDVIQLLAHCGNDWLKGELNGEVGMFPASFVEIIEDLPEDKSCSASSGTGSNETVALFDFEGEPGELTFQAGDKICILSKVNDQWLYGKCQNREGSFPASFVDSVPEDLPLHTPSSPVQKTPASPSEPSEEQPAYPAQEKPQTYCTALYDFAGDQDGDLAFKEGDHIEILEHIGQDWLRGRLHRKEGTFPAAFVQLEAERPGHVDVNPNTNLKGTGLDDPDSLVLAVALFDFTGQAEGELTFKAGQEIILGSPVSEGSEWQWGEANGKTGIFPAAFGEKL